MMIFSILEINNNDGNPPVQNGKWSHDVCEWLHVSKQSEPIDSMAQNSDS